jgi:hypothetical protein
MRHPAVVIVIVVAFVSLFAATMALMASGGEWDRDFLSVERAAIEAAK